MNHNKEVGCIEDDNNATRLPGSLNHEPTMGNSSDYAKNTPLDTTDTAGVIGQPHIGGDYAMGGIMKTASVTGPTGVVETYASNENLSAKYKYPHVHQDVPAKGRPETQYNDHS